MKITLNYARDFKVLPAYYTGFTATCRDEARHVQGGMRFVRELLAEDPSYVKDLHDTLRTLLTMSAARSGYVYYEPLGWSEERVRALRGDEMARFMTAAWAEACRSTINGWPGAQRKASKLQDFWDWIDMVCPFVTGRLALSVRDMPAGVDGDTIALDLDGGTVAAASILDRGDAETGAVFLLSGSHADWQKMLAGYDVGKMVMYRKLMLEQGDTLQFFMAAFYWTELLAAIQAVPVQVLEQV